MTDISIQEMMDAGAHFGHQTRRWNPKMKPFLYGAHSGIHIIDLQQTQALAKRALKAVYDTVSAGRDVLFVGTKKQAQPVIEEQAKRAGMPYVNQRWLGGMLTNFSTVRQSVDKLIELQTRREKNDFQGLTKKELLNIDRQIEKLEASLGGIKKLNSLPGIIFVVDPNLEKIAVHEANLLEIPVVALIDSNCDPEPIDYVIPANDDALRCIQIFASAIADVCLKGIEARQQLALKDDSPKDLANKRTRKSQTVAGEGRAYVSKGDSFEGSSAEGFSATAEVSATPAVNE